MAQAHRSDEGRRPDRSAKMDEKKAERILCNAWNNIDIYGTYMGLMRALVA